MRTSTTNLIAILTIGAVAVAASSASAGWGFGGGGGGGKGGGGKGGFSISFGGGNHKNHHHNHHHHGHHKFHHHKFHHHKYYHYPVKKYYAPSYVYDHCYEPYYSLCYVHPGDTWYTIAKRCYGQSHLWKHIASYNNLSPTSSALVPGQQLRLPVINTDGTLGASNAPAAPPLSAPQPSPNLGAGSPAPQSALAPSVQPANPTTPAAPAANIRPATAEPKRPIVTLGSTLMLDGTSLGAEKGTVRLLIGQMAMPVEVLQWRSDAVKIQMPTFDLAEAIDAELEVLRADGSLASKSAIELSPAATRLALGN